MNAARWRWGVEEFWPLKGRERINLAVDRKPPLPFNPARFPMALEVPMDLGIRYNAIDTANKTGEEAYNKMFSAWQKADFTGDNRTFLIGLVNMTLESIRALVELRKIVESIVDLNSEKICRPSKGAKDWQPATLPSLGKR
jgi:hypothetical protein